MCARFFFLSLLILKLFVSFLFISQKYRWLKEKHYLCFLMQSVFIFAFMSIFTFFKSICFSFPSPCEKQKWAALYLRYGAQKICLCPQYPPSELHAKTLTQLFHHHLQSLALGCTIFRAIFPWGTWNAGYKGYGLLISQLKKFVFGECALNHCTKKKVNTII